MFLGHLCVILTGLLTNELRADGVLRIIYIKKLDQIWSKVLLTEKIKKKSLEKKWNSSWLKQPPQLLNMVVVLLRLGQAWLPIKVAHWDLLMVLLITEATGSDSVK